MRLTEEDKRNRVLWLSRLADAVPVDGDLPEVLAATQRLIGNAIKLADLIRRDLRAQSELGPR
jgi:hypothetical protein